MKSGRTAAGRRAASSHTAALAANDDAVDALMLQCGVVRVDTIDAQLDTALVAAYQPLPAGNRIAIIGNSGGPGVIAADACPSAGLELADLATTTSDELRLHVAASASVTNPVDVLGDASPEIYAMAMKHVLGDPSVDAAIVIHAPTLVADPEAIAAAIASVETDKPIVAVIVGHDRGVLSGPGHQVPVFSSVESAVAALGHLVRYAQWRHPSAGRRARATDDVSLARVREVVETRLAASPAGGWLDPHELSEVLAAYGVPLVESETVVSAGDA